LRDHLLAGLRQGRPAPELTGPALPHEVRHLWRIFSEIGRDYGEMGTPLQLKNTEILAFQLAEGRKLQPWEIDAIRALDNAYRKVEAEARKKERDRQAAAIQPID
jgi:hypothetical protein